MGGDRRANFWRGFAEIWGDFEGIFKGWKRLRKW
jgi:hypothetical protein